MHRQAAAMHDMRKVVGGAEGDSRLGIVNSKGARWWGLFARRVWPVRALEHEHASALDAMRDAADEAKRRAERELAEREREWAATLERRMAAADDEATERARLFDAERAEWRTKEKQIYCDRQVAHNLSPQVRWPLTCCTRSGGP